MGSAIGESAAGDALPVRAVLLDLVRALADTGRAVLVAPPGAGKTTLVPPALLDAPWRRGGRILLLLPRRIAAIAAAERIAELLGESVGGRVGYQTRLESRPGSAILCLTYGLFLNRLIADPGLEGVAALLFDEVHERALDGDLALTLALDARALRPDLRLLAMSATIDSERMAALLDAPVIRSEGRSHPLRIRYSGRDDGAAGLQGPLRGPGALAARMARAIRLALAEEGSILAFLPGVADIERVAEALGPIAGVALHRLHGGVAPAAQKAALRPGGRKIVLATSIAETSLTIEGVRIVIDSGLARKPRYHPDSGFTRLETVRASRAAITQRAGRAAREGPGLAIRLFDEAELQGLAAFDRPEILSADLAPLLLRLLSWGVPDPASLRWLDPPPAGALAAARALLQTLGAQDADGALTGFGRKLAQLPLAPRSAALVLEGARHGQQQQAALAAVMLEERLEGVGDPDLELRLQQFAARQGGRAEALRALARRWAGLAARLQPQEEAPVALGVLLARAFPDRLARRRPDGAASDRWRSYVLANGRGARLPVTEPLARAPWLVVADAGGADADATIRLAATLDDRALHAVLCGRTELVRGVAVDAASGAITAEEVERLGAIELVRRPFRASDGEAAAALLAHVRREGLGVLPWDERARQLRARVAFAAGQNAMGGAALPDMGDDALLASLERWLGPYVDGVRRLDRVPLFEALSALLDWGQRQQLEKSAPERLHRPAGRAHAIDYRAEGGPEVQLRPQELFGLDCQPLLGGVPLVLVLLSPAGRPVARTRDLPGFWRAGWKDVRRDMKGRYPKHPWPDEPWQEAPPKRRPKPPG